jgi:hypothetical protein
MRTAAQLVWTGVIEHASAWEVMQALVRYKDGSDKIFITFTLAGKQRNMERWGVVQCGAERTISLITWTAWWCRSPTLEGKADHCQRLAPMHRPHTSQAHR